MLGTQPSSMEPATPGLSVSNGREKTYSFDGVFGPDADQVCDLTRITGVFPNRDLAAARRHLAVLLSTLTPFL